MWTAIADRRADLVRALAGEAILLCLGQEPALAREAAGYCTRCNGRCCPSSATSCCALSSRRWSGRCWRFWIGGRSPSSSTLSLDWVLMFGHLGFPALGPRRRRPRHDAHHMLHVRRPRRRRLAGRRFRRYHLFGRFWRPDWPRFREVWRLGLPIAATPRLRGDDLQRRGVPHGPDRRGLARRHAIAIQIASISFMVPLGLGQAVTVRVGRAYGAGDPEGIRARRLDGLRRSASRSCALRRLVMLLAAPAGRRLPRSRRPANASGRRARRHLPRLRRPVPDRRRRAGGRRPACCAACTTRACR